MSMIEQLMRDASMEMEIAKARILSIEIMAEAFDRLQRAGFKPAFEDKQGLIVLQFDPDAFDIQGLVAQVAAPPAPPVKVPAPKPAPAPKPVAAKPDPKPAPQPRAKRGGGRVMPTREPDAVTLEIIKRLARGDSPVEIRDGLNVDAKKVQNVNYRHAARIAKARAAIPAVPVAPPPVAPAKPPAPPTSPPAPPAAVPAGRDAALPDTITEGISVAARQIDQHLTALGYGPGWSAKADLKLAETLVRGDGAGAAAEALGITREAVQERWFELNTDRGSIDHQTRLLYVLRLRAETIA